MRKILYLIDGSAYIYRAYHAIPPLTNSRGIPTNAVFGFVNMLHRLLKDKEPEFIAVAFDSRGPVFRHEMYAAYKANRPPMPDDLIAQIPYIKSLVRASNIVMLEEERFEADDIIASLAVAMSGQGHEVVIVSGDKDLLQLVGDRVTMWDPMKNKVYDSNAVQEKYTIDPVRLLDYFALIGDSSDNVPGVPGVGPKTAGALINEYGSLDDLYQRVEEIKKSKLKERLIDHRDSAYLSRELIRLQEDVHVPRNIEDFKVRGANDDELSLLYAELEFNALLQGVKRSERISTEGFVCVRNAAQLKDIAAKIETADVLVIDTETTSLSPRKAELVGVSLCVGLKEAWYLPVGHRHQDGRLVEDQISLQDLKTFLQPFLLSPRVAKLGHNLKYDYAVICSTLGMRMAAPLLDTMIAAYLLDPSRRSYKLDDLCLEHDLQLTPFTEVVNNDPREESFAYVDISAAANYSCEDVYGCLVLWQTYRKELEENNLSRLFSEMEMKIVPILAAMEARGVCLDASVLRSLSIEFQKKINILERRIYDLAGEEFNINSPKQLGVILFEKLGLPFGRKTKTGYSTDVKVLEKLAFRHDLPAALLEYRTLTKLQSTYVEKLESLVDTQTGRVYTSFNQTVTATGRLSSSNPNLQNIPIRSEDGNRIRQAFIPGRDMVFLSADYSQIDLRVLAHYSQDKALIEAFKEGRDIHESTAREIFANPLFISPEMRRVAKSINFGIVYGMSSFGLANQLGLGRKEAQTFIDRYFHHYPGVKRFMEETIEEARRKGYVTTLCNRKRKIPEINAANRNVREFAERTALNTPIQGTAADIIKLAMIAVDQAIRVKGLSAGLLLQIHDELVFELPEDEMEETRALVRQAMESALQLDVPLVVNFEVGKNLGKG